MNIVLTCGHPFSGANAVHRVLVAGGLTQAQPAHRDSLTIDTLQTRILRAASVPTAPGEPIVQVHPGKVWHGLAADLFLGNLDQGDWGWWDPQSVWLMEFWRDFDPQLRFVLVYRTFGRVIAEMAYDGTVGTPELDAAATSLLAVEQELLRFYHRNRDRCLLVDADRVLREPAACVALANSAFGLALDTNPEALSTSIGEPAPNLTAVLARSAPDAGAELTALHAELDAVADLCAVDDGSLGSPDLLKAIAEFHVLVGGATSGLVADEAPSASLSALQQALAEAEQAQAEQQRLTEAAQAAKSATERDAAALRTRLSDQEQENRLLLQQLHQVQEELERQFLTAKDAERTLTEQKRIAESAQAAKTKAETALAEQKRIAESAQAAKTKAETALAEQKRTAETAQAAKTKAETALAEQKRIAESAQAAKTKAETALAEQKRTAETAQAAKTKLEHDLAEQRSRLSEQEKENRLLLLQLHQVQEELERQFLAAQETANAAQQPKALSFQDGIQPVEMLLDLRREIAGGNWYYAEQDGRWAGPEPLSTLELPALPPGRYELKLDIVDAMAPEILSGMTLTLNGSRLEPGTIGTKFPVLVSAPYEAGALPPGQPWRLELAFPSVVSPASRGSDDQRALAIRLRSLRIVALDLLVPATPPAGAPGKRKKRWWKRR